MSYITLNRHCNLSVSFEKIKQFSKNIYYLDFMNGKNDRYVWEMHNTEKAYQNAS
jgi:hypothetical protein